MDSISETVWNGKRALCFLFEGMNATLIIPEKPCADKRWLFKTEYMGAFPGFEIEMVDRGYYLANIQNETRWTKETDTARQARFAAFLQKQYGLSRKCMAVGMSCGGMQAIYLAARHPEIIAGCYLDAPVVNYLSCPFGVGLAEDSMKDEFIEAMGMTASDLINYRKHPFDYIPQVAENGIPIFLACGDSDTTVPYEENGKWIYEYYREHGLPIELVLRKGCGHHPHIVPDRQALIEFTENLSYS